MSQRPETFRRTYIVYLDGSGDEQTTYVSVRPYHLHRYLDEQAFRYNEREMADGERVQRLVGGIEGKRVACKELTGKQAPAPKPEPSPGRSLPHGRSRFRVVSQVVPAFLGGDLGGR